MNYYAEKDKRSALAKEHTKLMAKNYSKEIKWSIDNSEIYNSYESNKKKFNRMRRIRLLKTDSVSAIRECGGTYPKGHLTHKCAVLNFASYKHPGGMFYNGSMAQEEALCHESFLYNVISSDKLKEYYEWNKKNLNRALYTNRAIYTPDVMFSNGDDSYIKCDVLTCAAPNRTAAMKYGLVTEEENRRVLRDRIRFILRVLDGHDCDTVILGAFGCGVFGQDASVVARIFKEELCDTINIDTFVFAIIDDKNYQKFRDVFYAK